MYEATKYFPYVYQAVTYKLHALSTFTYLKKQKIVFVERSFVRRRIGVWKANEGHYEFTKRAQSLSLVLLPPRLLQVATPTNPHCVEVMQQGAQHPLALAARHSTRRAQHSMQQSSDQLPS